ncbi:MAG: AI-2E family transporter, partial [Bdellovibrionota bacterium]
SFFIVSNEIADSISDYLRAKLVEATLVGVLTLGGMLIIGAPYAAVLAVFAGITNIIPYVGPLMGAVPGVLIASFDSTHPHLVWPVVIVYAAANIIDTFVIFPVVVAKLVNLHPLILIAVVAVGQTYYGLVGMLISIPIATAVKVMVGEIYSAVYEQRSSRRGPEMLEEDALLHAE